MSKYVIESADGCTRVKVQRSAVVVGIDDLPCPDTPLAVYDFGDLALMTSAMVGVLFKALRGRGTRRTVVRVSKGTFSILKLLGIGRLPDVVVDIQIVAAPGARPDGAPA